MPKDNAAMKADPPKVDSPKRKCRWFHLSPDGNVAGLLIVDWHSPINTAVAIWILLSLIICLPTTLGRAQACEAWPRGHVFFATDFEASDALNGWTGDVALGVGYHGGRSLVFERPAEKGSGDALGTIHLPVDHMRGYVVQFSARIKTENVSPKPQPYNGVKFMAPIVTEQEMIWPAAELGAGTFDWKKVVFRATVPDDAKKVSLVVGLEAVTGKAWFDDIRVVAWKPLANAAPRDTTGEAYTGHDLDRLRGAMVSPEIDEEGLRVLGQQWNANLIRWQLVRREKFDSPLDLAAYDRWLQSALKQLDTALPFCEKYGLRTVVDLHSPPGGARLSGGYAGSDHGLFTDAACQRRFVEVWQQIAQRYKDSSAVWAYDLANEPVESAADEDLADWQELAERAAKAIRAIDPVRTIVVEPPEWGNPQGLRELRPIDVPNVVYSVHMYLPHAFTHQGVDRTGKAYRYPGEIEGKRWDKAQLETALRPAIEFQRKYNVHIYVGEFSAIRWAPDDSAYRYLKDLIDIFETHGWDWSYHAFREWDGWSVEHGADPNDHRRSTTPPDREQLLRSWLAKNRKDAVKSPADSKSPEDGRASPRQKAPTTFLIGADISWVQQQEDNGKRFFDNGKQQDILAILKNRGFNCIRLRIFHDPKAENGYSSKGYCDLDHTLAMAKQIKAAEMKFVLDFHYSDTWADPSHQRKPAAWTDLHGAELTKAVYAYTRDVVAALNKQGAPPDMVQIGNEISNGLLWPDGNVWKSGNWDEFCGLIKAGIAGAKQSAPNVKIILHLALGGQNAQSRSFLDKAVAQGVEFDIIGQSYYPRWHGSLNDLTDNLTDLATRYKQGIMVVEYSVPDVRRINDIVHGLPGGKGIGTCIWEPTMGRRPALFDDLGRTKPAIDDYSTIAREFGVDKR
jgi:arabinogalactan endo-1,4-beta-galactosidase